MPSQPRRAARDGRKPCGAIFYTMTGRKPAEGRRGAQRGAERPRLHHVHRTAPGGRRAVCPCPGLESMVKPRSRGGLPQGRQQAGRGCRPSAPSATFEISLSALLPLLGFLRFPKKSLLRLLSRHKHSQGISAQGLSCPSALPEDCSG